jgi:hypothetical protein
MHCGTLDSATGSRAHGRLMGVSGARATGPRVRDGMAGCAGRGVAAASRGRDGGCPLAGWDSSPGEGCPMECLVTIGCSPAGAEQLS